MVFLTAMSVFFAMSAHPAMAFQQIDWLKAQQDAYATGLVDSYQGDGQDYAYIYDQALAVIAFSADNETVRAKQILDMMSVLQDSQGRWYECYSAATGGLGHGGCYSYVTGPVAWMVMAVNYYEAETGDNSYAAMARKALSWLDTMRNTSTGDERYGSLRFCSGPACAIPNAVSTEHNHDAYSAYMWRGRVAGDYSCIQSNLTGQQNQSCRQKAGLIRSYLLKEMWAPSPDSNGPYHDVNVFWRGFGDFAWCTDTQSWGVLSLGPDGPNGEQLGLSLEWLYYNQYGSTRNQQDYNATVQNVDGFKSCTGDPNYIWLEGTDGVASAFYRAGDKARGDYFHGQVARVASPNGGVIHTFNESGPGQVAWPYNWRYNSVASTAWHYFSSQGVNPFAPNYTIFADVNRDCAVNIFDMSEVGIAYGTSQGQPGWNGKADFDRNGRINILDLATVGLNFGKTC